MTNRQVVYVDLLAIHVQPSDGQGGGGGRGGGSHPQQVFPVFLGNGKCFSLQTKFLAVGSSLGHLSMRKFFRSDLPPWL